MSTDPADFAPKLIAWQRIHGRHELPWQRTRDPYRIWVSEIMLQQTQVAAVVGYFQRFMERFPDLARLAAATEDEVLQLWSGLGYYARARNLRKAARTIVETRDGKFPSTAAEIAELPGIGRSTAAAVAAFAFGERGAILDGNVKRVLARRFGIEGFPGDKRVENRLWELACALLPLGAPPAIEAYTQGLMDLGATICTRSNPACRDCPIAGDCVALKTGRVAQLPAARPRKTHPIRQATWLVLVHGRQVMLERRPSAGIWGGLWGFPDFAGRGVARHCKSAFGCTLSARQSLPAFAHGFTHFRLEISPVLCTIGYREARAESPGRAWMPIEAAVEAAVPAPVRTVLRSL